MFLSEQVLTLYTESTILYRKNAFEFKWVKLHLKQYGRSRKRQFSNDHFRGWSVVPLHIKNDKLRTYKDGDQRQKLDNYNIVIQVHDSNW